jgi:hypothetical protein
LTEGREPGIAGRRSAATIAARFGLEETGMGFNAYENRVLLDDHTASFDKVPEEADRVNGVRRIAKRWDALKSDLDGLAGLKLQKPDFEDLFGHLVKSKSHAVMFELVLTKSELRLDVVVGNASFKQGSVRVPSDQEDYRNFLSLLNGWSTSGRDIVPDADFKKWSADNPKGPAKPPPYKDYDEMLKKSKSDAAAFREWAKKNGKAGKAFADYDKTAKATPTDPARAAAVKAVNESLKDYYKSF